MTTIAPIKEIARISLDTLREQLGMEATPTYWHYEGLRMGIQLSQAHPEWAEAALRVEWKSNGENDPGMAERRAKNGWTYQQYREAQRKYWDRLVEIFPISLSDE